MTHLTHLTYFRPHFLFALFAAFLLAVHAYAQTASISSPSSPASYEDIAKKITTRGSDIAELEKEIKQISTELSKTAEESKTLKNAVRAVDLNRQKIGANIRLTGERVEESEQTIGDIVRDIAGIQEKIESQRESLATILRATNDADSRNFLEMLLSSGSVSSFLGDIGELQSIQIKMQEEIQILRTETDRLSAKKNEHEREKSKLEGYREELVDQKTILDLERKRKDQLLAETKNKESNYQKLLKDATARKEQMEKELEDFAAQLKQAIDPGSIPRRGSKIFSPPLDTIRITQKFGRTADSVRLYASGTHNGADFSAPRGSKVYAVAEGTVTATGNTDQYAGCYSYGKWVLLKHPNGLSSMYAHLDIIKVSAGQSVSRGAIIGYSGKTGYATGPHLHLTIYATQGVRIMKYENSKGCKAATIPIAPLNAYLDPEGYL